MIVRKKITIGVLVGLASFVMNGNSQGPCATDQKDVNLRDCKSDTVQLDGSEYTELFFGEYEWALPRVNEAGEVEGTIIMTGKGYGYKKGDTSSQVTTPGPILRMDKGVKALLRVWHDLQRETGGCEFTNVHTHGLHASSAEDDPLIKIARGASHDYEYSIPLDHAGGTHWYHPHMHLCSEAWTGSGGAGVLIVNDDATNEIPEEILALEEDVFVFQNILPSRLLDLADGYTDGFGTDRAKTLDKTFNIKITRKSDGVELNTEGHAAADLKAVAEELATTKQSLWMVNGFWQPKITMENGKWYRWRLAMVAPVWDLKLVLYPVEGSDAKCAVKFLARDGVYFPEGPRDVDFDQHTIHLHPANRADLLIRCTGTPGQKIELYDIFNSFNSIGLVVSKSDVEKRELLVTLEIESAKSASPLGEEFSFKPCLPRYLQDLREVEVPDRGNVPTAVSDKWMEDDLVYKNFDSDDRWTTEKRFRISVTPFSLNSKHFEGWHSELTKNISIMMQGEIQEWELDADSKNHPLHIHVNHFQLIEDIPEDLTPANEHGPARDGMFRKGDWLDTVRARPSHGVAFRFQPDTFTGRIPLHCHNSDHADSGAIQMAWVIPNINNLPDWVASLTRPWNTVCPDPVRFATIVTPTTQAPTRAPEATLRIETQPVPGTLAQQTGVAIASTLLEVDFNQPVKYCWTRIKGEGGDYPADIQSTLQDRDTLPCDDDDQHKDELDTVFATGRRSKFLVIKPYALAAATIYTFQLSASQGSQSTTTRTVLRLRYAPSAPDLEVSPKTGTAGITPFRFILGDSTLNQNLLDNGDLQAPLRYRFSIRRNTQEGEPLSISVESPTAEISNVLLPVTAKGTDQLSFIQVTAVVTDAVGSESVFSATQIITVASPSKLSQIDIYKGYDRTIPEEVLRVQLSYASVLSHFGYTFDTQETSDEKARLLQMRKDCLSEIERAISDSRETGFSKSMGELMVFSLREFAAYPVHDSSAMIETVTSLFQGLLQFWLNNLNLEILKANNENYYPNLAFAVPAGVIQYSQALLSELSVLPSQCEWSVTLIELQRLVNALALAGLVPGQDGIAQASERIQTFSRKDLSNKIGGTYRPPNGLSALHIPNALFDPGNIPEPDVVLVNVQRLEQSSFCVSSSQNIMQGRRLRGESDAKGLEPNSLLASPVLHAEFIHNSAAFRASSNSRTVTITHEVDSRTPEGYAMSSVKCGVWDSNSKMWSNEHCRVLSFMQTQNATLKNSTVECTCDNVANVNDFSVWITISPVVDFADLNWPVACGLVALLVFIWLLCTMLLHHKDSADAEKVQKGAVIVILANRYMKNISKSTGKLRRVAFGKLKWDGNKLKAGFLTYSGWFLAKNSLLGLFCFDAKVSRVLRSIVPLVAFSTCCLLVLVAESSFNAASTINIAIAAVGGAIIALATRGTLNGLSTYEMREFHRVAYLLSWSVRFGNARDVHQVQYDTTMQMISPDEEELRKRQMELFMSKQILKRMKAECDIRKTFTRRIWERIVASMWFVRQNDRSRGLNRIYGGKVQASRNYRKCVKNLAKIERDYELRTPILSFPRIMFDIYVLIILCALLYSSAVKFLTFNEGINWVVSSSVAFLVATFLVEPLGQLLLLLVCKGLGDQIDPRIAPPLTKPSELYYSWDPRMSTKSVDHRKTVGFHNDNLDQDTRASFARSSSKRGGVFGRYSMFRGKKKERTRTQGFSDDEPESDEEQFQTRAVRAASRAGGRDRTMSRTKSRKKSKVFRFSLARGRQAKEASDDEEDDNLDNLDPQYRPDDSDFV